eukprot:5150905-Prymnesium_polylepis.1
MAVTTPLFSVVRKPDVNVVATSQEAHPTAIVIPPPETVGSATWKLDVPTLATCFHWPSTA